MKRGVRRALRRANPGYAALPGRARVATGAAVVNVGLKVYARTIAALLPLCAAVGTAATVPLVPLQVYAPALAASLV